MDTSNIASQYTTRLYVDSVCCWRCHQPNPVILGFFNVLYDIDEPINAGIIEQLAVPSYEQLRLDLRIGTLKQRYSRTAGSSYWSQGCRDCDALFGEFLLRDQFIEAHAAGMLDMLVWPQPVILPVRLFTLG